MYLIISNSKELKEWLGAEFSKWLSQDLKISIVPFYEGEGLTLNIGTTFSNSAEALNLKSPNSAMVLTMFLEVLEKLM